MRVRAPELRGRGWLNTGGRDVSLADLRGKIVLLDFWTFCCINCLHVLDELRPLEEKYADVLVIVGVHSPKFAHEADPDALAAAVERYDVHHPVLDDPELTTWQQYAVRAWPTLVVVDPEGYVVAQMSGEGHAHSLDGLLAELVAEHDAKGTLHRGDGPYVAPPPPATELRFPGKAIAAAGRHLPGLRLRPPLARRAGGRRRDRPAPDRLRRARARRRRPDDGAFSEPQGLCLLPRRSRQVGLRRGGRRHGQPRAARRTTSTPARSPPSPAPAAVDAGRSGPSGRRAVALSSPWDVAWHDGRVVVAMAGIHQLWSFDPSTGARRGAAPARRTRACSTARSPRRGSRRPSGLAAAADGALWLVDRRDVVAAFARRRRGRAPPSAPGCSTSATSTARPRRRCSSTRSASRCCPTARSPSATPTTARSAATTRRPARSRRWPPGWPSRATRSVVDGDLLVVSSRRRTG